MDHRRAGAADKGTYHVAAQTDLEHLELLLTQRLEVLLIHEPVLVRGDLVSAVLKRDLPEAWSPATAAAAAAAAESCC